MNDHLFGIENIDIYIVLFILIAFGVLEVVSGYLSRSKRTSSDWIQEVGSFFGLSIIIKPMIVLSAYYIGHLIFPESQFMWQSWSMWIALPFYLLIDDLMQYWYHRSAHEYEFLWKLHRPHHQAEEMGFFVSYRNAALYYIMMPNIWWVAICTFLGLGKAVALGLILKQLIIIGSHSTLHWDQIFYKTKALKPVVTLLERIIITPAFHHAHHGKSKIDGISDPNGNFGNMFSIWDQLFGTAKFTQQFPTVLGLENDPKEHWSVAYLYPALASNDPSSELSRNHKKISTKTNEPIIVHLEKDKQYLYCQCGRSKNPPFCDSSHHGTKFKPLLFKAQRSGEVKLCNCKCTKTSPFCDNSHLKID